MLGIIGVVIDAVTVGIDLSRDAEALDVVKPEEKDIGSILDGDKAYQDTAGSIVDSDQKAALWSTPFEPVVL
jgi:hypothetical protein